MAQALFCLYSSISQPLPKLLTPSPNVLLKEEKVFTLEQLLSLLTDKPATVFGIKSAGFLAPGENADIAIFDIEHQKEIKEEDFKSKGVNTPFTGHKVYGETVMTFIDGKVVYQRGTK